MGRAAAPEEPFPSPRGEGGSRRALLPAGARRVRGHFLAFSTDARIASLPRRTNSSGSTSTIAFGIRNHRMPTNHLRLKSP